MSMSAVDYGATSSSGSHHLGGDSAVFGATGSVTT